MKTFNIGIDDNFLKGKDYNLQFTTESDFTGYGLKWTYWKRPRRYGDTPLITKTTDDGITINSSTLVTVSIEDEDTEGENMPGSDRPNYWHELIRTDDGSEQPLSQGWVVMRQSLST